MTRHLTGDPAMTALSPSFTALTGPYTIDPTHTRIGFVARHAMVTKVRGSFNEFEGTAVIDGANPANSSVRVTIDAASIDTRNAQRDEHLRTNDFLALEQYPADHLRLHRHPPGGRDHLRGLRRPDHQGRDQPDHGAFRVRGRR